MPKNVAPPVEVLAEETRIRNFAPTMANAIWADGICAMSDEAFGSLSDDTISLFLDISLSLHKWMGGVI